MNFYEVLGLEKTATPEEIKKAYRSASAKYHPDRNPGNAEAEAKFKEVQTAFDTLGNPNKKAIYDNGGQNPNGIGFSPEDFMADFFGGSTYKGRNITSRIEIDLKEAMFGCKRVVRLSKRKRCIRCQGTGSTETQSCINCQGTGHARIPNSPFDIRTTCQICQGSGRISVKKCEDCIGAGFSQSSEEKDITIDVPAGVDNGMQLRLQGEGEESVRGGRPGDANILIVVKEHPVFTRNGIDLNVDVPISYTQLVLGDELEIPTLEGTKLRVKVPAGSQSHTKFRLKSKGFPNGATFGDLIATIKVETPKTFDAEYKVLIEKLSELEKKNITPKRQEFINNNK